MQTRDESPNISNLCGHPVHELIALELFTNAKASFDGISPLIKDESVKVRDPVAI